MSTASIDWWQTFFSGIIVESWLKATTAEQTRQEADFIRDSLGVPPPARLLDVPCGGGRHCHALASDGYHMTGVDLSPEFLAAANGPSVERTGTIAWENREMRDLPWPGAFDGAYCFGNSFGYLDDAGNAAFLEAVSRALKPGTRFVLETGYIAEGLFPLMQEHTWYEIDDIYGLADRRYDPVEGRLHVEYIFIRDGRSDRRTMSARIHTCRELIQLLEQAGFTDVQAYGSLSKEPLRLRSNNLLMVATKS